jgi:glutaredoxin 3
MQNRAKEIPYSVFHPPIFFGVYTQPPKTCDILLAESNHMKIKVYSTPTCPYCKLVKEFLGEKKMEFQDIDVASNPASANEMVKLSGQMGVPVVDVDGQVIVGWNKDAIEEALGTKNGAKEKTKT